MSAKLCNGPAHAQPTLVPLDAEHWPFHRSGPYAGTAASRCKLCTNWEKLVGKNGPHGWVPLERVRGFIDELIDRCGSAGAVERAHGISANVLRSIQAGERTRIQKRTAERVLASLLEQRKHDRQNGSSERHRATLMRRAQNGHRRQRQTGAR